MNPVTYEPDLHLPAIGLYSIFSWLMILGFCGLFFRFFNYESNGLGYISQSSYWIYLAHLPLVMIVQFWIRNWDINIMLKFLIVVDLATGILLLSYHVCVRRTFIGIMLNGRTY